MRYLVAFVLTALAQAAFADWRLTGLTYHDYCPPAAIRSGLCASGQSFVADAYITPPAEVNDHVVNQIFKDGNDLALGARIRVPLNNRAFAYLLVDKWLDLTPCMLLTEDDTEPYTIDVRTNTGRTFAAEFVHDGCTLEVRGQFTEASRSAGSSSPIRDVTMVFTDTACR